MQNDNGYEFVDLATVDKPESVSDTANVLIEEAGVIKRAPKSEVGVSSWNHLKDKPFYEEVKLITVIPETQIRNLDTGGDFWVTEFEGVSYFETSIGNYPQLESGVTYVVNFDGVDYICECIKYDISGEGDNYFFIGNHKLYVSILDGNNEPFLIRQYETIGTNQTVNIRVPSGEHTISISKRETVTHKIDKKYIPSSIGGVDVEILVLHYTSENGYHPITTDDYERIYNAFVNDVPVIIFLLEQYIGEDGTTYKTQYFMFENYINIGDDDGNICIETYYTDYCIFPDGTVIDC